MNSEYQKNLEARIDRALKALPDLPAPRHLLPQVMQKIARLNSLPWYQQPWQAWPVALRATTLAFLLASCGGLCIACWQLTRAAGFAAATQEIAQTFSGITAIWNTVNVLLTALVLVLKHFGTAFIIGCCAAFAFGYAICVGLGTACVRLAYSRR
ncbi:MAG TPA: hypothetical protein VL361_02330 [Candidatus Limnocylindrales bacterium]|jgi:hypothetical protein|nr:hypothetical protein [Candidatus Limnocylindrales bacterium]